MSTGSRSETLPTFIVIGAMKAGTTSLFHYLAAHPDVFMAAVKEIDFFVEELNWSRGLGWYAQQFERAGSARAIGEASTNYSKHPKYAGVPERIAGVLPDARIVYVLRDPIERIRSHYEHRVKIGRERQPFEEAIVTYRSYVDSSRYAMQIEQYLAVFPREHILLVTSEQLRRAREETIRRVYGFVGVDDTHVPDVLGQDFYRTESRATYSPATYRLRQKLKRYVPASKLAKELVDEVIPRSIGRVRAAVGAAPREEVSARPTVTPEIRALLVGALRDDVVRLRELMPADFDGWGIA